VRLVYWRSGTGPSRGLFLLALAGLFVVALVLVRFDISASNHLFSGQTALASFAVGNHSAFKASAGGLDYGKLPLAFELNQGQSDPDVRFLARGPGYGIFLTSDGAVLSFRSANPQSPAEKISAVRMQFAAARADVELSGTDRLPGKSNYFIGNDPAKWHLDLPQFARIQYHDLYPGIDLIFHGNQGRLEYDFEIAPGADPGSIQLGFENAGKLAVDSGGDLVLSHKAGAIRFETPRAYQQIGSKKKLINAQFVLSEGRVGFKLGSYDRSRALIIDPVLSYLTYVGGSGDEACPGSAMIMVGTTPSPPPGCPALAVDSAGNTYVAGSTTSTDFPTTPNPTTDTQPLQSTLVSPPDVFVTKVNAVGNAIVFSTYLGGHGIDSSAGLALNSGFDPVVAGSTTSADFPTSMGTAFQSTALNPRAQHAFVTELDPNGHSLVYSTYLSGTGAESASGVAVDFRNKIYVLGTTTSKDQPSATSSFPATLGAFQTVNGATSQFFLSKIDPTLPGFSSLAYSTYFGGSSPINALTLGGGIAVDASANVYITGGTNFQHTGTSSASAPDFPILNAYQGCLNTPPTSTTPTNCSNSTPNITDAFIAKINPTPASGSQLLYSSYLGGTGNDVGYGIAVDSGLQAYVTGSTDSGDFAIPTATVPFQLHNGGGTDAFVAKFGNPCSGSTCTTTTLPLNYFSYLGGAGTDVGLGIVADSSQGAHVTGWTNSDDFPLNQTVNTPIQRTRAGGVDAFVSRVDTTATSATAAGHSGTYLGGSSDDFGTSIANDAQGNTYVAGETASGSFLPPSPVPVHLGPLHSVNAVARDAFVSKLGPIANLAVTEIVSPTSAGVGNQVTFTYTIVNNGDLINGIVFTDAVPANATFVSASSSPGQSSCGATNGVVICPVGSLNGGASATVRVIFTPSAVGPLSDGGRVSVFGANAVFTPAPPPAVAAVNDFAVSVSPNTITVAAGTPATYTVTVTPTGSFPESVSLSAAGAPSGASPATSFPNGSSIASLTSGPQSRLLVINTAARVTTPASLLHNRRLFYVTWMPVSGFVLLGVGLSLEKSRRHLTALLLTVFICLIIFQAGCGSSSSKTITTGTPAGTYPITVSATSGSATRTEQVILIVE
jgi:uncharacterized repeat protein (TIGR01451 family)